jgi:hypothetical protein
MWGISHLAESRLASQERALLHAVQGVSKNNATERMARELAKF